MQVWGADRLRVPGKSGWRDPPGREIEVGSVGRAGRPKNARVKFTKRVRRLFTVSLIALISLTSCCAKQYSPEAYEALASLRKVQAATQVGVNYQQYGQLISST